MDVASIAAVLGLSVKEEEWDRALELIEKVKKSTEEVGKVGKKAGEEAAEGWSKLKEMAELTEHFLEEYVGYEGLKTIGEMTEQVVKQTMNLQHLSERYGVTVETLQTFDYAAKLTGTSLQQVTNAMQRMEFGLRATSKQAGMRGAAGALQKLGISATEFKKADMPTQLGLLAEKFEKMADPNQKIAMAMQLGGRGMVSLIPLLSKGKEKMAELAAESKELGYNLDPKKAEEYEEQQAKLQMQWDGLKTRIVELLLPALQKLQLWLGQVMTFFREHPTALHHALQLIGAVAAFTATAMFALGVRTLFAKGKLVELLGTLGPLVLAITLTVEAVNWTNEHLGKTPAIIVGVIGALVALRTVLRSIKAENGLGFLGSIGKKLLGARGGIEAATGAAEEGVAAEAGVAAEGATGGGGLLGMLGGMSLLPALAIGGAAYGAYELSKPKERPEMQWAPEDLAMIKKAGYSVNKYGDTHITAPIEIHTDATAEDVKEILQDHLDDKIRQAHQDMKDEE